MGGGRNACLKVAACDAQSFMSPSSSTASARHRLHLANSLGFSFASQRTTSECK